MNSVVRGLFRVGQPQIELAAAIDDLFDQLIDGVLVAVGEARDRAAHFLADAAQEPRR